MRNRLVRALPFALLAFAASCGDDNPADPSGDDPGPTGLQFDDFQAAAVVIGQLDKDSGVSNAGGGPANAVGLSQPDGAGCGALYVPDELNNRVLGFTGVPAADGTAASFALGQPDLTSSAAGTTAQNMSKPSDCTVADGKLFVVDHQNHRVLIWNSLPTSSVPADVVVGQVDFTSSLPATSQTGLAGPLRVAVAGGRMFVCDTANHRVLIWNSIPTTNGAPASVVLGQVDFTTSVSGLTAARLSAPAALWTDGTRLVVGDLLNRRLLIWNTIPTTNGAQADVVVGAADFVSAGSTTPSATSVGFPVGAVSDGVSLFVADGTFNRVLIYTPFPTVNGVAATGVLGQSSFTSSAPNDADQDGTLDGPSARTLHSPRDVEVIGNRLLVADEFNNRVLVFDSK